MPKLKKLAYTPKLGWSISRYDVFSVCKRRYFYNYYAKYDRATQTRLINQLKTLSSVPLEIGTVVHEVITVLLHRLSKETGELDRDKFFDFAKRKAAHRLEVAQFQEVVYGEIAQLGVDDLFPKVGESLENLLTSDRYKWLVELATAGTKEWIIDPPGYGESRLGELKVYCKVDFLFPIGDKYHILDWKTGKRDAEKHRKQLVGYSTWAAYHFEADPANIVPTLAYLHPAYEEVEETFNSFDLESFSIQVGAETDEMLEYCRDPALNVPLGIDEFPQTDDRRVCATCNYRGVCFPNDYHAKL